MNLKSFWIPFVISLFVTSYFIATSVNAAILINEVAWPYTNFVIVLGTLLFVGWYFLARTGVLQSWCLGKMGIFIVASCVPTVVHGAVLINEVAWMGSESSANDEWIELYNSGNSVNVDGWVLTDNVSLDIVLEGTIPGNSYAVLERTDDSSAPGSAFLIYTGALGNDGRTLTLFRADGGVEDQVAGGENWENIGGDNEAKTTAQRTGSGWITAASTPGRQNSTIDESNNDEESGSNSVTYTSGGDEIKPEKIEMVLPRNDLLNLMIEGPKLAYVDQIVSFEATPSGHGDTFMDSLKYSWSFGDAATSALKETSHMYEYPGTYVVVAEAEFGRQYTAARHEITVLPVTFSIGRNNNGDIQVHNNAKYEIDVGGFTLQGDMALTFPKHTILLPNATLTVKKDRIESSERQLVRLFDAKGMMVAMHDPYVLPETETAYDEKTATTKEDTVLPVVQEAGIEPDGATSTEAQKFETPDEPMVLAPQAGTAVEANKNMIPSEKLPYLGLVAVLVVGMLGIYTRKI